MLNAIYTAPQQMPELTPFLTGVPPVNVTAVANSLGIAVFTTDFPSNISGMLIKNIKFEYPKEIPISPSGWSILINSHESLTRQRFTIAHEIGHFVMHRSTRASRWCS